MNVAELEQYFRQAADVAEYPLFLQSASEAARGSEYIYKTQARTYRLRVADGVLPSKHDHDIFVAAFAACQQNGWREEHRVKTLDILHFCGLGVSGQNYDAVIRALRRYASVTTELTDIETGTRQVFHFLDVDHSDRGNLRIVWSKMFLEHVRGCGRYRYFDASHLRALSPLAARFFELVCNLLSGDASRSYDAKQTAHKLGLPPSEHYPSRLVARLQPAIRDIKRVTGLSLSVHRDGPQITIARHGELPKVPVRDYLATVLPDQATPAGVAAHPAPATPAVRQAAPAAQPAKAQAPAPVIPPRPALPVQPAEAKPAAPAYTQAQVEPVWPEIVAALPERERERAAKLDELWAAAFVHGPARVLDVVRYATSRNPRSYWGYIADALRENWDVSAHVAASDAVTGYDVEIVKRALLVRRHSSDDDFRDYCASCGIDPDRVLASQPAPAPAS